MTDLPQTEEQRPRQLAEPFAALREKLAGAVTVAEEPEPEREVFMEHRAFELERYPESATDCDGSLRIVDESQPIWPMECDACGFEVGVNMQRSDPERMQARLLEAARLPEMFAGREFEKGDPEQEPTLAACRIWLRNFKRDPIPAIALWGKPGRGKSHLLSLLVEQLVKMGVGAVYRPELALFDELQAAIDTGGYEIMWQRIIRTPVLALDDLGAGRMTEWRRDRLAALVDYRYSKELPLLVATNVPPAGWVSAFGDRAASRLVGMTVRLNLQGADRRAQGVQESLEVASA